jgi:hypothetical protein
MVFRVLSRLNLDKACSLGIGAVNENQALVEVDKAFSQRWRLSANL